ncbi:AmmeMemoRadiSam system protein B [Myxococcota bacterium]|nr:AmmeMemoRadiSam system protein B [Myxococcota bacterium]MBU1381320.1 AmmeMemoRadiSam system protein B [Myxococcota bacterium]MBU1495697.1 AmmeMemoRadiSam system protein B [Myxococcota bacterium]
MSSNVRMPAVSGYFYPSIAGVLESEIQKYTESVEKVKNHAIGAVVPHAGYVYSGATAGAFFGSLTSKYDTVVIIGPNHTGYGHPLSIDASDAWKSPLGNINIDKNFRSSLLKQLGSLGKIDSQAHSMEHSIEVQIPFIQSVLKGVEIVPVCIGIDSYDLSVALGEAIYLASKESGRKILVIASSDMTHFLEDDEARTLDNFAIERILALDSRGLYETVKEKKISMCGYMPACSLLEYIQRVGTSETVLLDYSTSADSSGDKSSVVGYAAIAMYK